jgi:hypothetical protein
MREFDRPYDIDETKRVLEELVERGIAQKRTVNGVTQYRLLPLDQLAPEALQFMRELGLERAVLDPKYLS